MRKQVVPGEGRNFGELSMCSAQSGAREYHALSDLSTNFGGVAYLVESNVAGLMQRLELGIQLLYQ